MQTTIEFHDETPNDVITLAGETDATIFAELAQALREDPRYRSGLSLLVDCGDLVAPELTEHEMQAAVEPIVERDWAHPPRAIAVVAPDVKTHALVTLANAYMGGSLVNRRVFVDVDEARAWLCAS